MCYTGWGQPQKWKLEEKRIRRPLEGMNSFQWVWHHRADALLFLGSIDLGSQSTIRTDAAIGGIE